MMNRRLTNSRDQFPDAIVRGGRRERRNQRAADFQRREMENFATRDWAEEVERDKRRRNYQPNPDRRTNRSQNFKKANDKVTEKRVPDFTAKKESTPKDEFDYDYPGMSAGVPTTELYSQNFDFSGFIDVVERTYNVLKGIDPRLERRLPYCMFLHYCSTTLWATIFDMTSENGERRLPDDHRIHDILPGNLPIPAPIYEYLSHICNVHTPSGDRVLMNLPEVAIPQVGENRGSFGMPDAQIHNVYECYISPMVTARRVVANQQQNANWQPLAPGIMPANLVPTQNLLGFGPQDNLAPEGLARLNGLVFPEMDDAIGRLQYCPELMLNNYYC